MEPYHIGIHLKVLGNNFQMNTNVAGFGERLKMFCKVILGWNSEGSDTVKLSFKVFFFLTGQERFGNMTRVYYKEAVGAFIVFDVTRASTFEAVQKWKNDLDNKVQLSDGSPVPCVLLANKVRKK